MEDKQIQLLDKSFKLFINSDSIQKEIKRIAKEMNKDLLKSNPLFLCILNGSFMFAADLLKHIDFDCSISFVKVSSYESTQSSGKIKHLIGLNENVKGRTIVILEDIIDTGFTIKELVSDLQKQEPFEIKVATMFFKSECCKTNVQIDYCGIEVPDKFIVGYGLDYNSLGRNYPNVYSIINT